ncbi:MAG: hypothetical protein ACOX52_06155 [Verrucomicrobiota bacterium]
MVRWDMTWSGPGTNRGMDPDPDFDFDNVRTDRQLFPGGGA